MDKIINSRIYYVFTIALRSSHVWLLENKALSYQKFQMINKFTNDLPGNSDTVAQRKSL